MRLSQSFTAPPVQYSVCRQLGILSPMLNQMMDEMESQAIQGEVEGEEGIISTMLKQMMDEMKSQLSKVR